MKILLIGEYSRLHLTLAEGLREIGFEVTLASDGDGFKNYERDIDLKRKSSGLKNTALSLVHTYKSFRHFKRYDIVQIINPCFTAQNININIQLYKYLRKNNPKVFLGAFGDDSFWLRTSLSNEIFRYSEFYNGKKPINIDLRKRMEKKWLDNKTEKQNRYIAETADGIIACLYEYYVSYKNAYQDKLTYIPLPINIDILPFNPIENIPQHLLFLIGINKERSQIKGTDIMERALLKLKKCYPEEVSIKRAESISYEEYNHKVLHSHIVLDQLYSYTPAMNALNAMAMGKIAVSGGEPEMYELLGEKHNHPVINVYPDENDVFNKLEYLIKHKNNMPNLSANSRIFVEEHHSYKKIAKQYLSFWNSIK